MNGVCKSRNNYRRRRVIVEYKNKGLGVQIAIPGKDEKECWDRLMRACEKRNWSKDNWVKT
jgi:hypothetical protein